LGKLFLELLLSFYN